MTTTVTVSANCREDKQVEVRLLDGPKGSVKEEFVLQEGQVAHRFITDDQVVTVREIAK